MSEHTPGPWIAERVPSAGWQIKAVVAEMGDDPLGIFEVPSVRDISLHVNPDDGTVTAVLAYERWLQFPSGDWREMTAANAELIACAPDWKEMAERLAGLLRGVDPGNETLADDIETALATFDMLNSGSGLHVAPNEKQPKEKGDD